MRWKCNGEIRFAGLGEKFVRAPARSTSNNPWQTRTPSVWIKSFPRGTRRNGSEFYSALPLESLEFRRKLEIGEMHLEFDLALFSEIIHLFAIQWPGIVVSLWNLKRTFSQQMWKCFSFHDLCFLSTRYAREKSSTGERCVSVEADARVAIITSMPLPCPECVIHGAYCVLNCVIHDRWQVWRSTRPKLHFSSSIVKEASPLCPV